MGIRRTKEMQKTNNRSNVGIEALRVLAMVMIVSLHYLGHGGVIHDPSASNYWLGWLIESASYVAVDCYVLISGYLLVNSTKFKPKRVFDIWFQVFFYSVCIFLISHYIYGSPYSLLPFMPIKFKLYWFATAYIGLYLLSPFLNKMMKSLDRKEFNRLIAILVLLLGVVSFSSIDTFQVEGGYSLVWMVALYIIGGYIRIFDIKFNKPMLLIIYAFLSFFTFYMKFNFEGDVNLDILYAYNSVTVLGASVALFLLFKDLKLDIPGISHFFRFFGPLTFGVYLIHENPYVRDILWEKMNTLAYYNSPEFIKHYAISILSVFFVCAFVEKIRQIAFKFLKI